MCVLGVVVLYSSRSARTLEFAECNRLYTWVMYLVIITFVHTVWYAIEEGFRVPTHEFDANVPGGVREVPLNQQNSQLFLYVRALRLILHFTSTLVFFIVGVTIYKNIGTCQEHTDLKLFFKIFWWIILVVRPTPEIRCSATAHQSMHHITSTALAMRKRCRW